MSARVIAFVCNNGLGHLRRVTGVLAELLALRPDVRITLVCEPWQLARARAWPAAQRVLAAGDVVAGVMAPGVVWSRDAAVYADGRLEAWIERVGEVPELGAADLVVTDNLGGVLEHRPDAVLLGSFLWSDILEAAHEVDPAVRSFVARERAALAKCRPTALCVAALATAGLRARAATVEVGWMCERAREPAATREGAVAVLGGATGAADAILAATAERLRAEGTPVVQPGARALSPDELAACAVAVVRPGAGTLNDCVAQQVPMVLVHEPDNAELDHNGRAVAGLGLGTYLGSVTDADAVVAAVMQLRALDAWSSARRALAAQPRDGLRAAARWLARRLDERAMGTKEQG